MKIFKAIILTVSIINIYGTFLNHKSTEVQYYIYTDLEDGLYREASTKKFENFNMDFPKLSVSAIPVKALAAQYYLLGERYNEALELLDESMDYNPYIMYNEMTKINAFNALEMGDSALYYSKMAFTKLPNNQKHFIELAKAYVGINKYEKLDSIFKIVKTKALPTLWKYYFASLLTDESKITDYGRDQANEALIKFGDNPGLHKDLLLSANYVLIGRESVVKSFDIEDEAREKYNNSEFLQAAELYEKSSELNPLNPIVFENSGICYFHYGDYENAIRMLLPVVDSLSLLNPKTGKSEFVMSQALFNLGRAQEACDYAYKATSFDYKEAFKLIGLYCK